MQGFNMGRLVSSKLPTDLYIPLTVPGTIPPTTPAPRQTSTNKRAPKPSQPSASRCPSQSGAQPAPPTKP
ncbi:uncharacterized protein ACHE_80660A [Aspergillus chevalieri]|uniref:Uncharacterized protein n=1 Tax=Aspergillus chevalieri TaxID=182096 RepID=A0A7R7VXX9_ASPCH|nr:uncharacterized protein ACHE_80660A [Aspergillus chevalieri]BCR92760.1 hypothetical protein ACHE_80660A [Aspergillus chevalieri]